MNLSCVPSPIFSSLSWASTLRRSRHVSSISAIMEGVERTFSPFQRKLVVWFELTVIVRSFEAPILTAKSMPKRDHKLFFKLVHEDVHLFSSHSSLRFCDDVSLSFSPAGISATHIHPVFYIYLLKKQEKVMFQRECKLSKMMI